MDANGDKNPERVAAGLKASVHNPHVSEAAKERARERLSEMGVDAETNASSRNASSGTDTGEHTGAHTGAHHGDSASADGHVLGGYKATLKNPHVSEGAKEHAKEVLHENDVL